MQQNEMLQSVFERRILEDDDVEFLEGEVVIQVNSIKLSKNKDFLALSNDNGYRIYSLEEQRMMYVCEGQQFPYGKVYDLDFMDDRAEILLIAVNSEVIVWDNYQQYVIRTYPILKKHNIHQLNYCKPFVCVAFDEHILVINSNTDQAYKYIKYIPYLYKSIKYVHNNNQYNYCMAYMAPDGNTLVLDNTMQQQIIGLNSKEFTQLSNEQVCFYLTQLKERSDKSYTQLSSLYICYSDDGNQVAVSGYTYNQSIHVFQIDWTQGKLIQLYNLYRGQTKKELRLFFGPNSMIACISFEQLPKQNNFDATLHLFYDHQNDSKSDANTPKVASKRRYYFRTWASPDKMNARVTDIGLIFVQDRNEFTIYSGFNFILSHQYNTKGNQIYEYLKDQQKVAWQSNLN